MNRNRISSVREEEKSRESKTWLWIKIKFYLVYSFMMAKKMKHTKSSKGTTKRDE